MDAIPNILAQRYASAAIRDIWSPSGKIRLEREYWIAVMKAQVDLGMSIPAEAIKAYEAALDDIDLAAIDRRERITRHDVKARIEAFNEKAGAEHIHKGMTSRDLTENVEQLQLYRSVRILFLKSLAVLKAFSVKADEYKDVVLTARTHNVAAQPTTVGKRIAMFGEDLMRATRKLGALLEDYPARGLKGAVGTQLDLLTLFDGDVEKVSQLESRVLKHLGLPGQLFTVGQVYPRSLDFEVISLFNLVASGPSSFARTLRLMAGHELGSEGFSKGQVGSSAMPHKMNARSCERINGFATILKGYLSMVQGLMGDQWNEGDVSCSVVRRVALPDACFALDGLLETTLTVLTQMEVYPAVIDRENAYYFPFLSTTTLLMEAVKAGTGREQAHEAIKENAVATVADLRAGKISANNLAERLAADSRLGLSKEQIDGVISSAEKLSGKASAQVDAFARTVTALLKDYPEAGAYEPEPIL
ncbi:adenylosuccinate lyase [Puniceicoccales bacterium CK1056]|uniref:Adenylosuccinate lyase n=1 Tax=Oceanipulchritudo coccoides TaxID=2706888 RepID=A0A6B2LZH0_9BACT|nr:adenylosuccinate lyase [Oceanipulchritudo coccoides]NDV62058.1 adenylosuccinate lyase [Oceanipulchritudo coccoides]